MADVYQYCTYVEVMNMIQHADSFTTKDLVKDGFAKSSHDVDVIVLLFCDNLAMKMLLRIEMTRIKMMMMSRRFV